MNESSQKQEQPFKRLGQRLRVLRQNIQESAADVSGAVEIDESKLERYEQGQERPSEDILTLLISHFDMHEDEAASLWHLAGYEQPRDNDRDRDDNDNDSDDNGGIRPGMLVVAVDPRIIYTDGLHVNAGPHGVVLSFAQLSGSAQAFVTARVGMSREQARSVVSTLQAALDRTEPRALPMGKKADEEVTADKTEVAPDVAPDVTDASSGKKA